MLPIIGFDYLRDDDAILLGDVVEAINRLCDVVVTEDAVMQLDHLGVIEIRLYPLAPVGRTRRLTKKEALKLLDITKQQEANLKKYAVGGAVSVLKHGGKRANKASLLVEACLSEWHKLNEESPISAEQLVSYCMTKPPQGYKITEKTQGKVVYSEAGLTDSVQIRMLKKAFDLHLGVNKRT